MSIKALPQTAVRAIGAAQVLTDSSAVVKELVDNALDARATSIAVEIHANTLDSIQVRDNGHGISPQDRPLVAKRYCTSKLTNADDLSSIGGSSLGFRGEALASAAEMSGGMTVTTRVEGEQVATTLKIDQQGGVAGQERVSAAVGTTVKITDFIKSNPVRRQVALKHIDQSLKRIKHLLQSFAFARPHVRLSLKVIKAKNDKGNWMYAPKAGGNVEDAAFKIVGAACASQCTWSVIEEKGFKLQAFLPRPDAPADKLSNVGAFVSVDFRPLTPSRGIAKQMVKVFREALKKSNPRFEGIKDPFLYLEIACPEGAYDPNIEPAKDDVLFEDPDKVVMAARKLFAATYPSPEAPLPAIEINLDLHTAPPARNSALIEDEDDFVTSLEQAQPVEPSRTVNDQVAGSGKPVDQGIRDNIAASELQINLSSRALRHNIHGWDEEDLEAMDARPSTGQTEAESEELRNAYEDVTVSNPWAMAKSNAYNKRVENTHAGLTTTAFNQQRRSEHSRETTRLDEGSMGPPTPRASSPTTPAMPFHPSDHVPDFRLGNDGRIIRSPSPSRNRFHFTPTDITATAGALVTPSPSQQRPRPAYNCGVMPHSDEPQGTPLRVIPQAKPSAKAAQNNYQINKPFVSPLMGGGSAREKVWFDHLEGIEERGRQRPRRQQPKASSSGQVHQGEMDGPRPLSSPHRNRDIRDFVASVDLTGDRVGQDVLAREGPRPVRSPKVHEPPVGEEENALNNYGALRGHGFVPASELAALGTRVSFATKPMAPPPKRRKTGQGVLRQIRGDASPHSVEEVEADQEYLPESVFHRRSIAKLQRTKPSRLPLERIPTGKGTHNLVVKMSLSSGDLAPKEQSLDLGYSLLEWNEPAIDAYDVFAEERSQDEIQAISDKLHELLINRVSDGDMVRDLGKLVEAALFTHAENMNTEDGEDPTPSQQMLDISI
jgi:DNA mismatch repair protein MutL